jgi:hypothetical protein
MLQNGGHRMSDLDKDEEYFLRLDKFQCQNRLKWAIVSKIV